MSSKITDIYLYIALNKYIFSTDVITVDKLSSQMNQNLLINFFLIFYFEKFQYN